MYRIENLLRETMGLDAASVGSSLIERTVRLRMKSRRLKELEEYRQLLETSPAEMNDLIESVVVAETWFFRDREAFAAMVRQVVNEWLPANSIGALRILSVPCSTGEEPYSLAMALLDAGLPQDRFQVDAVDISALALDRAGHGIYGKNSFRASNLDFRKHYFQPVKDGFLLSPAVRSRVFFKRGNLLDDKCLTENGIYDFIFCRNLLIYFNRPTQAKALQKLDRLLAPAGLCFVGPAELPLIANNGFVSANIPMAFACRKADALPAPRRPARISPQARSVPAHHQLKPGKALTHSTTFGGSFRASQPQLLAKPAPARQRPDLHAGQAKLETAQRLADAGKLSDAAALSETHLREHGPCAHAYYLIGRARDAAGEAIQAATCYRKALYLEPQHSPAMLQLALLAEKDGDITIARQLRQRMQRVAKQNRAVG